MMQPPHQNALVVKSNALVEAMSDMGLQEMRFLAFAVSQLPRDLKPEKGKPYDMEINVAALANTFNLDPKNIYREIRMLSDRLMRKIIEFNDEEGRSIGVGLLSKRVYHHGEGRLWFRFDEDLLPHIMGLTEKFTKYRIKDVYQFQRTTSWRVYELLKQYKALGKREIEVEDFKWKLGISDKYPRIVDMRKRVIEPAIEEINATSDIKVQYDQKKRGRRITSFIFYIVDNQDTKTHREEIRAKLEKALPLKAPKNPDFAHRLREEFEVAPKQADQLARLWEGREDQAEKFLARIKRDHEAGMVKSLGGLTFRILRDEGQKTFLPGI